MPMPLHPIAALPAPTPTQPPRAELMDAARALEQQFLSEMLGLIALDSQGEFAGGSGEAQFTSFLRGEQARLITERGGIGLAQSIVESLAKRVSE